MLTFRSFIVLELIERYTTCEFADIVCEVLYCYVFELLSVRMSDVDKILPIVTEFVTNFNYITVL